MPKLRLLPLGTVIKGKDPAPGWEKLRFMVVGYFPIARETRECFDYVMAPWPLGYVNYEDGTRKRFYSCNEDAIGAIEFLGAVDEELKKMTDWFYQDAIDRTDSNSPIASGVASMVESLGDLKASTGNFPPNSDLLPLGSVVSTVSDGDRKMMIYQHSGIVDGEYFDYGICNWPEGVDPGSGKIGLIKQEEITAVHFHGYENALSQELAKRLEKKRRGSLFSRIIGKRR